MAGMGKVGNGVPHGGRTTTGGKGVAYRKYGNTRGVGIRNARKVFKDAIHGISKGDVRRLARRGGVKRISAPIYDEMRRAMKDHLIDILRDCAIFLENSLNGRKTVTVDDVSSLPRPLSPISYHLLPFAVCARVSILTNLWVIFALKRRGRPIYGFGNGYSLARPDTKAHTKKRKAPAAN